jgi:hypothetical protein
MSVLPVHEASRTSRVKRLQSRTGAIVKGNKIEYPRKKSRVERWRRNGPWGAMSNPLATRTASTSRPRQGLDDGKWAAKLSLPRIDK